MTSNTQGDTPPIQLDAELDRLIEDWIIIETKDPLYVKEAKMKARKDFRAAIQQALERERATHASDVARAVGILEGAFFGAAYMLMAWLLREIIL